MVGKHPRSERSSLPRALLALMWWKGPWGFRSGWRSFKRGFCSALFDGMLLGWVLFCLSEYGSHERTQDMTKTLIHVAVAAATLVVAGCQTWGPTWSEVSNLRYYNTTTMYLRP